LKAKNILCCVIARRNKQQSAKVSKKKFALIELANSVTDTVAGMIVADLCGSFLYCPACRIVRVELFEFCNAGRVPFGCVMLLLLGFLPVTNQPTVGLQRLCGVSRKARQGPWSGT